MGLAISEGPVLPSCLHQRDQKILRRQPGGLREDLGHALEEFSFLLWLAAKAQGDLDKDDPVGALDAKVLWIVDQIGSGVLGDDLEMVVGRDGDSLDHGTMHAVSQGFAIFWRGARAKKDLY